GLDLDSQQVLHLPISMSIALIAANVTEFRLKVVDLETTGSLAFTSLSGGTLGVTGELSLTGGDTVGGAASESYQGDLVVSFGSPVTNPSFQLVYTPGYSADQTPFSGLSYTVAAIPEPVSFVWFASVFGLVQY